MKKKPKLAIWKFASCDGCQLTILDCEDELLTIGEELEIAYFPEATSKIIKGPYDISLVEGSITQNKDKNLIKKIRKSSRFLIAIGACATAGGIQALRNFAQYEKFASVVYPTREYLDSLDKSLPIADFVQVDFQLRGCPISKKQIIEVITAFLFKRKPNIGNYSVCMECKRKGLVCVAVAHNTLCLGPLTMAGCGAICPSYNRGCYGCFGPKEEANTSSLSSWWQKKGISSKELIRVYRTFNAYTSSFYEESNRLQRGKE